jgi:hypothetical protein
MHLLEKMQGIQKGDEMRRGKAKGYGKCKHCGEIFDYRGWRCLYCGRKLINECSDCHCEVRHNIITPIPFNICANPRGGKGLLDDDFSFERAVKLYEKGDTQ